MKIAILTQPPRFNYGGILQTWTLQQILRRMGHEPETVHWMLLPPRRKVKLVLKHYLGRLLHQRHHRPLPSEVEGWFAETRRFVDRNVALACRDMKVPRSVWKPGRYDAYIVGSDQIWRPEYNPGKVLNAMFLEGAQRLQGIRRVAYAASFGADTWEFDPEQTEMARRLLPMFDAVSVREDSGVTLCRERLGVEAVHVLDPTLMLTADDYRSLISDSDRKALHAKLSPDQRKRGYVWVYILDRSEAKMSLVSDVCSRLGLQPLFVGPEHNGAWVPPLEEWLAALDSASYVVTDSFHGAAFSIIYHKRFSAINNRERGGARLTSLLRQFDLEDRERAEAPSLPIDWAAADARLESLRTLSRDFLRRALGS